MLRCCFFENLCWNVTFVNIYRITYFIFSHNSDLDYYSSQMSRHQILPSFSVLSKPFLKSKRPALIHYCRKIRFLFSINSFVIIIKFPDSCKTNNRVSEKNIFPKLLNANFTEQFQVITHLSLFILWPEVSFGIHSKRFLCV